MHNNPAFARSHKDNPKVYRFFKRLNRACLDQREAPRAQHHYATVSVTPLNGGTGAVYKNFTTELDFEIFYRSIWRGTGPVPDKGVGGVGNGIINYSWRIWE
jgi:hypothetical protein